MRSYEHRKRNLSKNNVVKMVENKGSINKNIVVGIAIKYLVVKHEIQKQKTQREEYERNIMKK